MTTDSSFNPLTSGAGTATRTIVTQTEPWKPLFQSPDERGGYCDMKRNFETIACD